MNKVIIARRVVEDVAKIANKEREIIIATLERLQQDPFTNVYSEQLITHPNAPPSELHVQDDSGFFFGTSLPNRRSKFFILEKQRETCRKVRDHNLVPLIRVRACGSHNKKS